MEFTEMEKRMLYQTEGTERYSRHAEDGYGFTVYREPGQAEGSKKPYGEAAPLDGCRVHGNRTCVYAL